jgi:hypothetical protein
VYESLFGNPGRVPGGGTLAVTKPDRLARSLKNPPASSSNSGRLNIGGSVHDPTDPVGRLPAELSSVARADEPAQRRLPVHEQLSIRPQHCPRSFSALVRMPRGQIAASAPNVRICMSDSLIQHEADARALGGYARARCAYADHGSTPGVNARDRTRPYNSGSGTVSVSRPACRPDP